MELRFKYNNRDILACSLYLIIRMLTRYWIVLVIALVITLVSMETEGLILFGSFLLCWFLLLFFLLRERLCKLDAQIKIKEGILTLTTVKVYERYYCDEIERVRKTRKHIWLDLKMKGIQIAVIAIPVSALDGKMEPQEFLEFFERQKDYACQLDKTAWISGQPPGTLMSEGSDSGEPEFHMEILWTREMVEAVNLRNMQIQYIKEFAGSFRRRILLGFTIVWLIMFVTQILLKREQIFAMVYSGIALLVVTAVIFSGSKNPPPANRIGKLTSSFLVKSYGIAKEAVLSQISVSERGICVREAGRELTVKWERMKYLLELNGWFLIYSAEKQLLVNIPAEALNGAEEQERFTEYCSRHGVEYRLLQEEKSSRIAKYVISCALVLGITFAIVLIQKAVDTVMYDLSEQIAEQSAEQTTEYVFRPEEFEDYIPIEKQVSVLKSLDIRIPQSLVEEEQAWMEEHPRAHEWLEARPYYMILGDLGFPEYDEETYEVTSYSNQAYTLYWDEAYDLAVSYTELLNGVNAMSRGEYTLTSPAVLLDGVDETDGTGTVQIYFLLNGTPYLYTLTADSDWLDTSVLRCINDALGKENVSGRLYALDDDGWSCVLFYRDKAWASEFARKTGIRLVMEYTDK